MAKQSYWTKERKKLQRKAAKALRSKYDNARDGVQHSAANTAKSAGTRISSLASREGISNAAEKFYGSRFGQAVDKLDRSIGNAAGRLVGQRRAQVSEHTRTLPNGKTITVAAGGMTKGRQMGGSVRPPARKVQPKRQSQSKPKPAMPKRPAPPAREGRYVPEHIWRQGLEKTHSLDELRGRYGIGHDKHLPISTNGRLNVVSPERDGSHHIWQKGSDGRFTLSGAAIDSPTRVKSRVAPNHKGGA